MNMAASGTAEEESGRVGEWASRRATGQSPAPSDTTGPDTQLPTPNAQPPTSDTHTINHRPSTINPVASAAERVFAEMHKAIVGQEELVEMLAVALLSGGHVLL